MRYEIVRRPKGGIINHDSRMQDLRDFLLAYCACFVAIGAFIF